MNIQQIKDIPWIEICGDIVNAHQITHINPCVSGSKCGASYDEKDNKFAIITLASKQAYRLGHTDPNTTKVLKTLNLNFNLNGA